MPLPPDLSSLPSVDRLLQRPVLAALAATCGHDVLVTAVREVLEETRAALRSGRIAIAPGDDELASAAVAVIDVHRRPSLRRVFNLTGTVLHTNLGRAPLPDEAVEAMRQAASEPSNLEMDLGSGRRGNRDAHISDRLCRLTGAEAATVVNNNAAAVLLVLNTLALRGEVPTSRSELVEIGGSFRIPDIMARAGCRLREVGTTNRVHLHDYEEAIGPRTKAVMRVHTSNFAVVGFTARVPDRELARLCHDRQVPFVVDLGSGTLVDLRAYGLPYEPTARETLAQGADLVTFSGDKLLGGPQAGIIVGRQDLVTRLNRNPLKRALRMDKVSLAGLDAVLRLYEHPHSLVARLPVLRALTRAVAEIRALALRVQPVVAAAVGGAAAVSVVECASQVGSGALPSDTIPSVALVLRPARRGNRHRVAAARLAAALRGLPVPIVGRVVDDAVMLDLRTLEDEATFVAQWPALALDGHAPGGAD
jgi:L-seryl-tRNA(Ser) seleniumtransferase